MTTIKAVRILYGEAEADAFEQTAALRRAGYDVTEAVGRKGVQEAIEGGSFDLVVLGHTFTKEDRHHLPYAIKKIDAEIRLLVLHASGHHPKVDLALDSRRGEEAVQAAVADLLLQPVET